MKKVKTQPSSYVGSAKLQLFLIAFTGIAVFLLFWGPVLKFYTSDKYLDIISLTPQKVVGFGGYPSTVRVGMYISDFSEFDIEKKRLVANITVWFKFDPRLVSIEKIGKFTLDKAKVLHLSKPSTRIEGDEILVRYNVWAEFTIPLNYENFPFDDHTISFSLTHYLFTPSELMFEASQSDLIVGPEVKISGWKLVEKSVRVGYIEKSLASHKRSRDIHYPRAIFSMDFSRVGVRHIISIIVPLFLIFFIALFTLCMTGGISLSFACMTGIIAHRFIIENMSPKAGYFMVSDHLFLLFLAACSVIFVINIFEDKITAFYKNLLAILMHLVVLFALLYLLYPLF